MQCRIQRLKDMKAHQTKTAKCEKNHKSRNNY